MDLSKTGYVSYRKASSGAHTRVSLGPKRLTDKKANRRDEIYTLMMLAGVPDERGTTREANSEKSSNSVEPCMVGLLRTKRVSGLIYGLSVLFLAGCTPLYIWDTHITSTPRQKSIDVAELIREPVATLGPITPAGLQGFSPFLSRALIAAMSEASPSIRGIPAHETVNMINGQGLSAEYGELISGFVRSGILERERLQRLGSKLGSRYVLLPGLADFNQVLIDRFEITGLKIVRNRVITLRLWLQLWDTQTGQIVWESTGEVNAASELLLPQRITPLDEIGQKLWRRMIEDNLLAEKTQSQLFFKN
jgi:hypothetical protein